MVWQSPSGPCTFLLGVAETGTVSLHTASLPWTVDSLSCLSGAQLLTGPGSGPPSGGRGQEAVWQVGSRYALPSSHPPVAGVCLVHWGWR